MPKLLIFDAFTLLIREKNVAIYALLRCKMSQFTHFCGVKFLASKSGTWEFWTNFMSDADTRQLLATWKSTVATMFASWLLIASADFVLGDTSKLD